MTLVGASANLITAGAAEHCGHKIGFLEFMKVGTCVVFITCTVATVYSLVVYSAAGWQNDEIAGGDFAV